MYDVTIINLMAKAKNNNNREKARLKQDLKLHCVVH